MQVILTKHTLLITEVQLQIKKITTDMSLRNEVTIPLIKVF